MDRRKFLGSVGGTALTVSLAGCTEAFGQSEKKQSTDNTADRGIIAEVVDSAPNDATVINATTGQIGSVKAIQDVLGRAVESDQGSALRLLGEKSQLNAVQNALKSIPYYEGENTRGYFLEYNDTILILYQFYRKDGVADDQ